MKIEEYNDRHCNDLIIRQFKAFYLRFIILVHYCHANRVRDLKIVGVHIKKVSNIRNMKQKIT